MHTEPSTESFMVFGTFRFLFLFLSRVTYETLRPMTYKQKAPCWVSAAVLSFILFVRKYIVPEILHSLTTLG